MQIGGKSRLIDINEVISCNKISNEKFELYEENGRYFLRLDFDYEDSYGYYKGHIERIEFDLHLKSIDKNVGMFFLKTSADLGIGKKLDIFPDSDGKFYTIKVVKEKIHEMTIDEIEKKLGYKVKIVSGDK